MNNTLIYEKLRVLGVDIERYILMLYDEKNIRACGGFAESLEREYYTKDNIYELTIYGYSYIAYVEFGRPPSDKLPPIDDIKKWIKCKGIVRPAQFKTDDSFAWAVATNIKKFGTSWFQSGGAKFIEKALEMIKIENRLNSLADEVFVETIQYFDKEFLKI